MKFLFKKLAGLREADRAAIENSKALLEETHRTDPDVDREHELALKRLKEASEQARRLKAMDAKNHYSESLTKSFRGRTA
jgi:phosphate uptake regulator